MFVLAEILRVGKVLTTRRSGMGGVRQAAFFYGRFVVRMSVLILVFSLTVMKQGPGGASWTTVRIGFPMGKRQGNGIQHTTAGKELFRIGAAISSRGILLVRVAGKRR